MASSMGIGEAKSIGKSIGKTEYAGFDHGVGHPLLLLYDTKASNCQKSKKFKGLGHYPSTTS